ncbi:MAG: restriction endonuclease subunit S [Candidatus Omnitrophica bacterium]|nr:restriction endonuclease subunit S [Candidatus Omnitrophota bacterium]MCG2710826.1 restriction endonuclease subunit S [Candidatus Omnitrophota bacterium]
MQQTITKIPTGYKQTELGVIPEDWEINKLSNVAPLQRGFDLPTSQLRKGPFPVVYSNGILNFHDKAMAKAPGVVTGRSGTIGKVNYIEKEYWPHNTTLWVTDFKGNDEKYVYFLYSHIKIERFRTGSGVPTLNRNDVHEFKVSIPKSKTEQTAIATVLSDTDALIERLEKLIAKKKAIKQGAMQQLLTGKKRLPGFSGEWEVKKLREIGELAGAGIDKKSKPDEVPVRLVNYLDVFRNDFIYSKDLNHWVTAPTAQAQRCAVKRGDVFFTPSSEMRWDIGISAVAMEDIPDAGYSYHVDRLRLFDDWDLVFRTYIFKTKNFLDQAETICEGSGKRYVISLTKFREMTVKYPVDKTEQTAIATILFDMDADIESLEQKRNKYIMLKQGMMQQLLTGKIRLN